MKNEKTHKDSHSNNSKVTMQNEVTIVIQTDDNNVHTIPAIVFKKIILGKMNCTDIEEWDIIQRTIIREWLMSIYPKEDMKNLRVNSISETKDKRKKLSNKDKNYILELKKQGRKTSDIARMFNVSKTTIGYITSEDIRNNRKIYNKKYWEKTKHTRNKKLAVERQRSHYEYKKKIYQEEVFEKTE